MKMKSPKVMNTLLAHIWDKWLKIYKHILMKVHECKMRVLCKWTKPNETRGETYERKGSEFCNWAFIKMDLKIFLRTYKWKKLLIWDMNLIKNDFFSSTIAPPRQSKHLPTSIWVQQSDGRRLTKVDIPPQKEMATPSDWPH